MTLDEFFIQNYKKLQEVSKNISHSAEWHRDAIHLIIVEVYEMNNKAKWQSTFNRLLHEGKMINFLVQMINTQYKSTTSSVWREIRRTDFDESQINKISDYMYSTYEEDRTETERRLQTIKLYLNLFNPIDVIIYKDYLLNDKTMNQILEDWNISRKYFYNTISLINKGIKLYLDLREKKKEELIELGIEKVDGIKSKPKRQTRMELVVIYNLLNTDKVDNYDNDQIFKKVKDYFKNQPFNKKYKK